MESFVTSSITAVLIILCTTQFTRAFNLLTNTVITTVEANDREIDARFCAETKALALNIDYAEKILLKSHPGKFLEITSEALKIKSALRDKLRSSIYDEDLDDFECPWIDLSGSKYAALPAIENQSLTVPNWTVKIRKIQTQEPNP